MENGNGAFVFCSEKVLEDRIRPVAEQAVYEGRMRSVIHEGREALAAGRGYEGAEAAFDEIARRRAARHG